MAAPFTEIQQNEIRDNLIHAGIRLSKELGLQHMSVSKLTTEAGIAKGSFYAFFESKEAFILSIIEYSHKGIANLIQSKLHGREKMSAHEFCEFYLEYLHSEYALLNGLAIEDHLWLKEHMKNEKFFTLEREKHILEEWLSYVDDLRPDANMGVIVNLDNAITAIIERNDIVDQDARDESIRLLLNTMEIYISGKGGLIL